MPPVDTHERSCNCSVGFLKTNTYIHIVMPLNPEGVGTDLLIINAVGPLDAASRPQPARLGRELSWLVLLRPRC
ncbi:hypothetical protein SFRURICE_011337 [Spodoptera frugiperda]|nr:hypothetical protein SFRURICE_011337 [Spodoptera frugiperda]